VVSSVGVDELVTVIEVLSPRCYYHGSSNGLTLHSLLQQCEVSSRFINKSFGANSTQYFATRESVHQTSPLPVAHPVENKGELLAEIHNVSIS
jgi:hypothetical protein